MKLYNKSFLDLSYTIEHKELVTTKQTGGTGTFLNYDTVEWEDTYKIGRFNHPFNGATETFTCPYCNDELKIHVVKDQIEFRQTRLLKENTKLRNNTFLDRFLLRVLVTIMFVYAPMYLLLSFIIDDSTLFHLIPNISLLILLIIAPFDHKYYVKGILNKFDFIAVRTKKPFNKNLATDFYSNIFMEASGHSIIEQNYKYNNLFNTPVIEPNDRPSRFCDLFEQIRKDNKIDLNIKYFE